MFQVLHHSPVILYAMTGTHPCLFDELRGRTFHVYLMVTWYRGLPTEYIARIVANGGTFTICANSSDEHQYYRSLGLASLYCSHNAFLDWNFYRPLDTPKDFDFVVNSVLLPYKRHELLPSGFRFAMISQRARDALPWEHLSPAFKNQSYLPADEVNQIYNKSRLGVILSSQEGACWSSTEYLLAGLPVVSTPSRGGRDLYYGEHNSILCEPTVTGVRRALEAGLEKDWSPDDIRSECIKVMQSHRERFAEHLSMVARDDGERLLQKGFVNRLLHWFPSDAAAIEYLHQATASKSGG